MNFKMKIFVVLQGSGSEATFVALLAAKSKAVKASKVDDVLSKLVAYCSDQVT